MKRLFIGIIMGISVQGFSQTGLQIIGEGKKLEYEVKENSLKYKLTVSVRQFRDHGDKDMVFDWQLSDGKTGGGQLSIPKANLSYSDNLKVNPASWVKRLETKEIALLFPSSCSAFMDAESTVEINGVVFNMDHKKRGGETVEISYNSGVKNFPYWEIESTGSYPDAGYTFWLSAIRAKLDAESDEQGGSPYKIVNYIYSISMKGFEMKLVKISN